MTILVRIYTRPKLCPLCHPLREHLPADVCREDGGANGEAIVLLFRHGNSLWKKKEMKGFWWGKQ